MLLNPKSSLKKTIQSDLQSLVLAPHRCIFLFHNLQSKCGPNFFTSSYFGLCIIKISSCVCFNLYNYVVVDAFLITAVNDCINPGNSRMSSDSLLNHFL